MSGSDVEAMMATMTYYVALAFMRSEDGSIVACEPKEACSSDQAIRMASSLAAMEGHCGAIAFARTAGLRTEGGVLRELLKPGLA
jgi:hypothetical protein